MKEYRVPPYVPGTLVVNLVDPDWEIDVRLREYTDYAAKVGRLFGIKLAQRRGAKR